DLAVAPLAEIGGREREETGFDETAAALASDRAMPRRGFFREGVVQVREDGPPAAAQRDKYEVAEEDTDRAQEKFGRVGGQPAGDFKQKKHATIIPHGPMDSMAFIAMPIRRARME